MTPSRLILLLAVLTVAVAAALLLSESPRPEPVLEPVASLPASDGADGERTGARVGALPVAPESGGVAGESSEAVQPLDTESLSGHFGPRVPSEGRTAGLRGRITAGGQPVRATLRFTAGPNTGAELSTDADGSYDWSELYPGYGLLRVEAGSVCARELTLRHRRETTHDIDFEPRGMLFGRVLDADGAPIVGAEVELDGNPAWSDSAGWFSHARSVAGEAFLVVRAPGYTAYCERIPEGTGTAQDAPHEIELRRGSILQLSLSALGEGSSDEALVWLVPGAGERLAGRIPRSAYPWHELNPLRVRPGESLILNDMPHSKIDALVFHRLGAGSEFAWLTDNLALVDRPIPLHVELKPASLLSVRVSRGDEPEQGARVELAYANRMAASLQAIGPSGTKLLDRQALQLLPAAQQHTLSDEAGQALLGLHASVRGTPFVRVSAADGSLSVTRAVEAGAEELLIDLARPAGD